MTVRRRGKGKNVKTNYRLPDGRVTGQGATRHPLSSGAYFDASTNVGKQRAVREARKRNTSSWYALKLANRVKRGKAAQKQYRVDIYADMLKIRRPPELTGLPAENESPGGKRGEVSGFSRASRKRMLEFMASIRNQGTMLFLTLTYDDAGWLFKHDGHQRDLEAFRRRFERAFPSWSALWRVEVKERKSGDLEGWRVPHFHMLIFTNQSGGNEDVDATVLRAWGAKAWSEITGAEAEAHETYGFHVTTVRSRKHAYYYVSKYVSKLEESDNTLSGFRRWGRINTFAVYASETFALTEDEVIELRRIIKRWLRNTNRKYAHRFARLQVDKGTTVFGLGDTEHTGLDKSITGAFAQFIHAAKTYVLERNMRERGHAD